jgi:hypothetical protein
VLALWQLVGALWMYGRLVGPRHPAPAMVGPVHRVSGAAAVVVSLVGAVHTVLGWLREGAEAIMTFVRALFT